MILRPATRDRRRALPFWLAILLLLPQLPAAAQNAPLTGTWRIDAVLIATSVPNPQVHRGFRKQEYWRLQQQGAEALLMTQGGSVQGRWTPPSGEFPEGAWRFQVFVPNFLGQPTLAVKHEVVIVQRSAGYIAGGSRVSYYGRIALGAEWVPRGLEVWRFEGMRVQ